MTNPNMDCGQHVPEKVKFTVNLDFIPEGEEDLVQLDILYHYKKDVLFFLWKEFEKNGKILYLRHKKSLWMLKIAHRNILSFEYMIANRDLRCSEGICRLSVNWPEMWSDCDSLFLDLEKKLMKKGINNTTANTYKWLLRCSKQFLLELNINIEKATRNGKTLLHLVARIDNPLMMQAVLSKFDIIDIRCSNGVTPLHEACKYGVLVTAQMLLDTKKADVNAKTPHADTCLILLAKRKEQNEKFYNLLLKNGAKRGDFNNDQMRAVDYVPKTFRKIKNLLDPF